MKQTQLEAYKSIENKNVKQMTVLKAIKENKGATFFELVEILDWPINCITGRVNELCKIGLVKDSGKTKQNPKSKKSGIVWRVGKKCA